MTPGFARFASDAKIHDEELAEAIQLAEGGVIDADPGDSVIRQWIGHPGKGKSDGFHALIAYRPRIRAVFLYAFSKHMRGIGNPAELQNLKLIAADLLSTSSNVLAQMMYEDKLIQVNYDEEEN